MIIAQFTPHILTRMRMPDPPLKFLHPHSVLNKLKLAQIESLTTEAIILSLQPGCATCLKARPDGTVLDGHHRLFVLRSRGENIDSLPRKVLFHEEGEFPV